MGSFGSRTMQLMQQAGVAALAKEKQSQNSTSATKTTSDTKLPMSKRRTRSLQKQSQLNNQTTLLGG